MSKFPSQIEIVKKFAGDTSPKTVLEIGSHDNSFTKELAEHFKEAHSYYEFLKIPDKQDGNMTVTKMPHTEVLTQMKDFDVVIIMNEFHHLPDVLQMQTYDALEPDQVLILFEWDLTGTANRFYKFFQDCVPLCVLARQITREMMEKGTIEIVDAVKSRYEVEFGSIEELVDYHRYELPDHWKFGKEGFMEEAKKVRFPFKFWEGFDAFKVVKGKSQARVY